MAWRNILGRALRWLSARTPGSLSMSDPDWAERMAPFIRRYPPRGSVEKFPVLLLLHGCAGDFPHLDHWARLLSEAGYLVYTIDSLTPRNIPAWKARCLVCIGLRLPGFQRSRDITAALSLVGSDPMADLSRIGLIGWSHGAWTVMEWLYDPSQTRVLKETGATLASLIFVYPYCGLASIIHQQNWPATVPVLIVTAEHDRIVSNRLTEGLVSRLQKLGLNVTHVTMHGAKHAFDLSYKKSFNPDRTADLQDRVLDFLTRELAI